MAFHRRLFLAICEAVLSRIAPRYIVHVAQAAKKASLPQWFIGYAFGFKNTELRIDWFGSPVEILQAMASANVDPYFLSSHKMTQVVLHMVSKDGRDAKFSGSPNVPKLMQLMDALVKKNWQAASRVIELDPQMLRQGSDVANVPLKLSAANGQTEAVEFLLSRGAAPDGVTPLGMTPLHWCAVHGQAESASALLKSGADPSLKNWFLLTPAQLALANLQRETLQLLTPAGAAEPQIKIADIHTAMGCMRSATEN